MPAKQPRIPSVEEMRQAIQAREAISMEVGIAPGKKMEQKVQEHIAKEVEKQIRKAGNLSASLFTPAKMREAIIRLFEEKGYHPIAEMIEIAQSGNVSEDQRIRIASELAQYIVPKLKTVEVSGQVEHTHTLVIERYGEDGTIKREALKQPPMQTLEVPAVRVAIEEEAANE